MDFTLINWGAVIVAGLVATAVITMLMYAGPVMGMPKMDIAQMIGSMVLPVGGNAFAMGMLMHFVMGVIFAIVYALVWLGLEITPSWWTGLIFGAVHFVVAAMGMGMMSFVHPEIKAGRLSNPMGGGVRGMTGMLGMLIGHLVFGVVVALIYRPFVV